MAFRTLGISVSRMPGLPISDSHALARRAEAAGFGILGVGEAASESFSQIGALSVVTSRAELFSGIATWTRTPLTTALGAATLADLSGDRYRLGLGTMPRPWSENWHGIDAARPVERMRDFIAAIRAVWGGRPGSTVEYSGPFYTVRDYEPVFGTPAREGVPIYIGPTRRRMAELTGEVADGAILNTMLSRDWIRDVMWPCLDRGLERSGRSRDRLDVGLIRICAIDDDADAAYDTARRALGFYFRVPYFADMLEHGGFDAERERGYAAAARGDLAGMAAAISDDLLDAVALCGTPAQVREKLRPYEELVDWVQLVGAFQQEPAEALRQMDAAVATFAPAVAAL